MLPSDYYIIASQKQYETSYVATKANNLIFHLSLIYVKWDAAASDHFQTFM